jgi:hypothetical protein
MITTISMKKIIIKLFPQLNWSARRETPAGAACQGRPHRRNCAEEAPEAAMDKRTPGTEINWVFNVNTIFSG